MSKEKGKSEQDSWQYQNVIIFRETFEILMIEISCPTECSFQLTLRIQLQKDFDQIYLLFLRFKDSLSYLNHNSHVGNFFGEVFKEFSKYNKLKNIKYLVDRFF